MCLRVVALPSWFKVPLKSPPKTQCGPKLLTLMTRNVTRCISIRRDFIVFEISRLATVFELFLLLYSAMLLFFFVMCMHARRYEAKYFYTTSMSTQASVIGSAMCCLATVFLRPVLHPLPLSFLLLMLMLLQLLVRGIDGGFPSPSDSPGGLPAPRTPWE